jgi:hypothetical protein
MPSIKQVIEDLKGTCSNIDVADFTIEELEKLDSEIFECSICGWWYDIEEEVGEGTTLQCKDCKNE